MDASAKLVAGIVGSRIRRIRRGQELSQDGLARYAEVHRSQISLIEHGQRLPRIDTLVRLAGGLLVPSCDLLGGVRWEPAERGPGRMVEVDGSQDA